MTYVPPSKEELARRGLDENGESLKAAPKPTPKSKAKAKAKSMFKAKE
jgi:hypothetical protein